MTQYMFFSIDRKRIFRIFCVPLLQSCVWWIGVCVPFWRVECQTYTCKNWRRYWLRSTPINTLAVCKWRHLWDFFVISNCDVSIHCADDADRTVQHIISIDEMELEVLFHSYSRHFIFLPTGSFQAFVIYTHL